jgi:ankyrin repeat protein
VTSEAEQPEAPTEPASETKETDPPKPGIGKGKVVLAVVLVLGAAGAGVLLKLEHDRQLYHERERARIEAQDTAEAAFGEVSDKLERLRNMSKEDDTVFSKELCASYAWSQKKLQELKGFAEAGLVELPALEELGWGRFAHSPEPLLRACRAGDAEAVKILLSLGSSPQAAKPTSWAPLGAAARAGHPSVVKLLLEAGAKPLDALEFAATSGSVESARLLLEAGAEVDGSPGGKSYRPPLSQAVSKGKLEVVRLLLDKGADPNLAGYWALSRGKEPANPPLHSAITAGAVPPKTRAAIIELLLAKGADPNPPLGSSPRSPISRAMNAALRDRTPESIAIVETLFKAGATLNPGPEPFDEGDNSFEGGHPPRNDHYYRKPPLLAGFSAGFGKKVSRKRLYEVVKELVALARAARPDEVAAQTKATVNRLSQSTSNTDRFLAPGVVGALQPAALDLRHASRVDKEALARFVANHRELAVLHLGFNEKLDPGDLSVLRPLTELRHLTLRKGLTSSEALGQLENLPSLRSLALGGQPKGASLARLTQLQSLDLHSTKGTFPDLAFLESLTGLVQLDLFDTEFKASELERLASLPELRVLSLPFGTKDPELEVLLRVAPQLEELRFRKGSRLSDAGLARLAAFKKLRTLAYPKKPSGLRDNTPAGLEALRAAAPELKIVEPAEYVSLEEIILRETRGR